MTSNQEQHKSFIRPVSVIIVVLAVILLFIGYQNGEHKSYFQKAVMVCTQCIGLG